MNPTHIVLLLGAVTLIGGNVTVADPLLGEVIDPVSVTSVAGQSYALYLPTGYDAGTTHPVLYCFDPRGRGGLCVERYREAAERFGYIVVSSNNSRSDGPIEPNLEAMKAIWRDSHERFRIDDTRVYATGFSGGARVANLMGQVLGIAGVIACGAGFPPSAPPSDRVGFAFYAMVGEIDFNYYEVRRLDRALDRTKIPHRVVVFDGAHQWASPEDCGDAVAWMELHGMRRGRRPVDPSLIRELYENRLSKAAELEGEGRHYDAASEWAAIVRDFDGLLDVTEPRAAEKRARDSREYRRVRRERDKIDRRAFAYLDRLALVLGRLTSAELLPPSRERLARELEVERLLEEAGGKPETESTRAAMRLLEMVYVQTSFTQASALRSAGQPARAAVALEIAATIKPEVPTVWYNLACAQAQSGDLDAAIRSLERAVREGFDDDRWIREDPDLEPLRGHPELPRLLGSIRARS